MPLRRNGLLRVEEHEKMSLRKIDTKNSIQKGRLYLWTLHLKFKTYVAGMEETRKEFPRREVQERMLLKKNLMLHYLFQQYNDET